MRSRNDQKRKWTRIPASATETVQNGRRRALHPSRHRRPAGRGRDAETPKGDERPQRSAPVREDRTAPEQRPQQRTAPLPEQPPQQRRAAPQPESRPEPSFGKANPSDQQRGQGQARPSPREEGPDSDRARRDRPVEERSAPPEEKSPQQRAAPQPEPRPSPGFGKAEQPARGDNTRTDQARPSPREAPGKSIDGDRARREGPAQRERVREERPRGKDDVGEGARRDQPRRLEDVKKDRVERVEAGGRRVIEEPGSRFIIRDKGRAIIRRDESRALERFSPNARTRDIGEGRRRTVIERPDGSRVISEVDRNGRLLRRYRRDRSGREIVLIDNRRFYRNVGIGLGVTALGIGVGLALAPPAYNLPRGKYIVEYDDASEDDLYEALSAPPGSETRAAVFARGDPLQPSAARVHAPHRPRHDQFRIRVVRGGTGPVSQA